MSARHACRLLVDPPQPGAWNMAVDEVLLEQAADAQTCCWRFYQWSEPTLSLGYFQRYAEREGHAASRERAVVRRTTGGGAILHDRELTYSLTGGAKHPLCASASELYRTIHGTLVAALSSMTQAAALRGSETSRPPEEEPFLCFSRRAEGDLVLNDIKVCGSAQRRHKGAILQHGSVLLERSPSAPELNGLRELLGVPIAAELLIEAWLPRLSESLGLDFERATLSADEVREVEQVVAAKHGNRQWIEHR